MFSSQTLFLVIFILGQQINLILSDCVHGELYPHSSDCGLFYQCSHGQLFELSCREGLHFSPSVGVCDWPEIANCEYVTETPTTQSTTSVPTVPTAISPSTTTTASTTTATTTTTITTTTEETTTEEVTTPPTPPAPTSAPVLTCETPRGYFPFPPPDNCVRYYYCFTGTVRFRYECRPPEFFTPGGDRCTTNVPPGCEHLVP